MNHLEKWAVTSLGSSLELYHSSGALDGGDAHPIVLLGGVHGDEPEGVELAKRTLEWIKTANANEVRVPWVLIPIYNPDGYRKGSRTNGRGVDLNRNFPASNWSMDFKLPRYNPGSGPGSEAETQALVGLIEKVRPRLLIHFHSWHPMVVCTGNPGLQDALHLSEASGYEIKNSIGYETPGSLSQFGWNDNQIPVICVEEQEHLDLALVWPHFASGIKKILADDGLRKAQGVRISL